MDRRRFIRTSALGMAAVSPLFIPGLARAESVTYGLHSKTWYNGPIIGYNNGVPVYQQNNLIEQRGAVWLASLSAAQQMQLDFITEISDRNAAAGFTSSDVGYQFCDVDTMSSNNPKTDANTMQNGAIFGMVGCVLPGTDGVAFGGFDGKILTLNTVGTAGLVQKDLDNEIAYGMIIGGAAVLTGGVLLSPAIAGAAIGIVLAGAIWVYLHPQKDRAVCTVVPSAPLIGPTSQGYIAATANAPGNLTGIAPYQPVMDIGVNTFSDPNWSSQAWFKAGGTNLTSNRPQGLLHYYS